LCADPWKDTDGQAAKELEHASPLHLLAYRPVGTRAWSSVNQLRRLRSQNHLLPDALALEDLGEHHGRGFSGSR
jgi:hypothetical protein|tara:strand:+ start:910 stop:1131 length:222 start_codon:yes stop_codon:yes gene_type:complete